MAAPTHTAIGTPAGIMLRDGFKGILVFARRPNIQLKIITAKPPGWDNGDSINQTTMHSTIETSAPQAINKVTNPSGTAAYDPKALADIRTYLIGQEGSCTYWWPDGSYMDFYGYLKKADPSELKKGERPELAWECEVTNWDPVAHTEQEPVITEVAGT